MRGDLRKFHREFFNALCDIFGEAVNVLVKLAAEKSGLDRDVIGSLLRFIDESTCIDIKAIVGEFKEVEFSREDALRLMRTFLGVTEEVLGEGVIALAKLAAEYLRKFYGEDLVGVLERVFGNIARMKIEKVGDTIRFIFRPRMREAYKYMPMTAGIPFPALVCVAAKLGEKFVVKKFEHKPDEYCLIEVERG